MYTTPHRPTTGDTRNTDITRVSVLGRLSDTEVAGLLPALLRWLDWARPAGSTRCYCRAREDVDMHISLRLSAAPAAFHSNALIVATETLIATPATTPDTARLKATLMHPASRILRLLPKEQMELYRVAFTRVKRAPTPCERALILDLRSADFLRFLNASRPYIPTHKTDDLAYRTLDLIRTTEEMHPLVPGLVGWCRDPNLPTTRPCFAMLKRFPQLAVAEIRGVLRAGEDGQWQNNLLWFLQAEVAPAQWACARREIERIAQQPTHEEIENQTNDVAIECLRILDDWQRRGRFSSSK